MRKIPKNNIYKTTGIISILLGIIGITVSMVVGFEPKNIAPDLIGAIIYNFPRIYFGRKLIKFNFKDFNYILKISKIMLVYSIVTSSLNFIIDGGGYLFWILIYLYFIIYINSKKNIDKNEYSKN